MSCRVLTDPAQPVGARWLRHFGEGAEGPVRDVGPRGRWIREGSLLLGPPKAPGGGGSEGRDRKCSEVV